MRAGEKAHKAVTQYCWVTGTFSLPPSVTTVVTSVIEKFNTDILLAGHLTIMRIWSLLTLTILIVPA